MKKILFLLILLFPSFGFSADYRYIDAWNRMAYYDNYDEISYLKNIDLPYYIWFSSERPTLASKNVYNCISNWWIAEIAEKYGSHEYWSYSWSIQPSDMDGIWIYTFPDGHKFYTKQSQKYMWYGDTSDNFWYKQCLDKTIYNNLRTNQNQTIISQTTQTTTVNPNNNVEFSKTIEDAKKIIEQKQSTISPATKILSPINEKKAILLKKRIQNLRKQLELLEKQLNSLN